MLLRLPYLKRWVTDKQSGCNGLKSETQPNGDLCKENMFEYLCK